MSNSTKTKKIGLMEVKEALKDARFRDTLPLEVRDDVAKYLQNPGCPCNMPTYKKLLLVAARQLKEYYGVDSEISEEEAEEASKTLRIPPGLGSTSVPSIEYEFNYIVINCHVDELSKKMNELNKNMPKQIAIARYEDQITCIVTEMPMKNPQIRSMPARN